VATQRFSGRNSFGVARRATPKGPGEESAKLPVATGGKPYTVAHRATVTDPRRSARQPGWPARPCCCRVRVFPDSCGLPRLRRFLMPSHARMTNTPCGLTDPSAVPNPAVRAMPLTIVNGATRPLGGQPRVE
jgi:hypothetical protein